ncbi:MAG: hypothetical protein CMJ52_10145 [Planctomycetaceae bacterium]|nr:hypothetical protein [Planctomycetaceae bacterium]
MMTTTPPTDGGDPGLFELDAEVALLIAAIFLTLLVVGFVAALIVSIVREEREVAKKDREDDGR